MSETSVPYGRANGSESRLRMILYILVLLLVIFLVATIVLAILYAEKDSDSDSSSDSNKTVHVATTAVPNTAAPAPTASRPNCPLGNGTLPKPANNTGGPYAHAAVAADDLRCSNVGEEILRKGSAVDAAIATIFCLGVINMQSTGIGGGGVMVVYSNKTKTAHYFNFRETAPENAMYDMFVNNTNASQLGALAIAVPAEVKGMFEVHKKYGKLNWTDLVKPAIDIARNGFIIHDALDKAIESTKEIIFESQGLSEILVKKDGCLRRKGDLLVNTKLAITLERISYNPMSFYEGELAKDIINDISSKGGIMTLNDLNTYSVEVTRAINASIGDQTLFTTDLPSSGIVLAFILNVLKGYNFTSNNIANDRETGSTYHKIIETFKYAYARRALLGDKNYVENITEIYNELLSEEYADSIRLNISNNRTFHNATHYGGYYTDNPPAGTSHVSVLGKNGDAVSVTSTINTYFGSKFRSTVTGIMYNNQMDDFSTPGLVNSYGVDPSSTNFIQPGKRPMSSMSPVIFTNKTSGEVHFIAGASGGTRITTGTALASMYKLWFGRNTSEAVTAPRFHHQLLPNYTAIEEAPYTLSSKTVQRLLEFGHIVEMKDFYSVVQAVSREQNGEIYAKSDPRKGGYPAGF